MKVRLNLFRATFPLLAVVVLVGGSGCALFDPDEAARRERQKERERGYRTEPSRWEKMKEWERVKYRDWYRRMTD